MTQRPRSLALLCLLIVLAGARPAWAWKVTTHQAVAVKAAQELPDGDLKTSLLANERHLRAGSMGPDIFYLPPFMAYNAYSDLAHYCKTDRLALNMVSLADSRGPQAKAFAWGWFAHNVGDSVAHPWVNGFTGQPYRDFAFSTQSAMDEALNLTHMGIEGWVDKQLFADGFPDRTGRAIEVRAGFDAFFPYILDETIQELVVDAYTNTYQNEGCQGRPFKPLTKEVVSDAGRNFAAIFGALGVGDFVLDLSDPEILDLELKKLFLERQEDVQLLRTTWKDYVSRAVQYTSKAWQAPSRLSTLPDLNLDQGIDPNRLDLRQAWETVKDLQGFEVGVFTTPGHNYVFGGAQPTYEDRCEQTKTKKCEDFTQSSPGADTPDETASVATPATTPVGHFGRAFSRLATKKGKRWAATFERIAGKAAALHDIADPEAFLTAFAALGREYDREAAADPALGTMTASYHTDETLWTELGDVALLENGYVSAAREKVEGFGEPGLHVRVDDLSSELASRQLILVIPTGGLYGLSESEQFRLGLEAYVSSGGTAVVFSQQHGTDFSVLPTPDDQPIRGWGWHEDNSCYTNGAYIDTFHSMLASQSNGLVTSNLDGYFESMPANAIVLLRRVKNGLPTMFMYPYGQGWVVVSSSYDDWGGFNQTTPGARAIIRDAIAWAKKPADLPINRPGSTVSIVLQVKNVTNLPASQMKLVLMSPSRDRVVTTQTVGTSLPAEGAGEVAFSFTFPADAELGIYHVDYELLDDAGVTLQPVAEADSGRIVIASPPTELYQPADLSFSVVMPGGEEVLADDQVVFRYRIVNRRAEARHFHVHWRYGWTTSTAPDDVVVPGNSFVERDITVQALSYAGGFRFWSYLFEEGADSRFGSPIPGEAFGYLTSAFKGHFVRVPAPNIELSSDRAFYTRGQTAMFQATITNFLRLGWEGTLQLRSRRDGTVYEQPFAVGPMGSSSVTQAIPVGDPRLNPDLLIATVLWRGREVAGGRGIHLRSVEPELRTVSLSVPAWSRTAANPVTWTLENVRAVPLNEGSIRAEIQDSSGVVWEESRALTLPEGPGGRAVVALSIPPLSTLGLATLTLTANNGFGRLITARTYIAARLEAAALVSSPAYTAGESGEVSLTLANHGAFLEEGQTGGAIQGVAPLGTAVFSVPPRQMQALRIPFEVPASTRGGLYPAAITLPNAPPINFTVRVGAPRIQISVNDTTPYGVGDSIPVTLKNVGGSRTTLRVVLRLGSVSPTEPTFLTIAETRALPPGQETTLALGPIPSHVPTGDHEVGVSATDRETGVDVALRRSVRVTGTAAALTVRTDRDLYATGAPLVAGAQVVSTGTALESGLLHLEVVTPCAVNEGEPGSYHIETWDGERWVERTVRHRGAQFETDLADMADHLSDAGGAYRVRIRQTGPFPASLDSIALLSGGALLAPTEATMGGSNVLHQLMTADDAGVFIYENAVEARFPAAPQAVLVFRAREGAAECTRSTLWQKDYPLDLAPGAGRDVTEALTASGTPGQYILAGMVRTRDGAVLARAEKVFDVVSEGLSVSVRTEAPRYRIGTEVPVFGRLRNDSVAAEPDLILRVFRKEQFGFIEVHVETLALAGGETRNYSFSTPAVSGSGLRTMGLVAEVYRSGRFVASNEWSVAIGEPRIQASLRVPDPKLRLVPTGARLVAAEEGDLDAATRTDDGALEGALPFPLTLFGQSYAAFRQSVDGFVELVPAGAGGPRGSLAACLDDLFVSGVAPALGDLDPTTSGFVGHRFYPAGSADRAGRVFPDDTLAFFWDAPAKGDTRHNRFQVLLARDGLVRIDAETLFLSPTCPATGVILGAPSERASVSPPAPFGLRLESGVGRGSFEGSIRLQNSGDFPGTVTLDYGRATGPRTTTTLTLVPGESRSLRFEDAITDPTTYTLEVSGDTTDSAQTTVTRPSEALSVRYVGGSSLTPGSTLLPVVLTKKGSVGGSVQVAFTLTGPTGPQTITRTYDLEPGIPTADAVGFDVPEGSLILAATASVPLTMDAVALRAAAQERLEFTAAAGAAAHGVLPIVVDVGNTGLLDFAGRVQIEGPGGSETPVAVGAGGASRLAIPVTLAGATPGTRAWAVRLVSEAGSLLAQTTVSHEVIGPRLVLAESPEGQVFDSASTASLRFVLRNTGDQEAWGRFRFEVFDEQREAPFDLAPGAEVETVFQLLLDDDVEQKVYPGRYAIEVAGLPAQSGPVHFTVNGLALVVEAVLDKDAYAEGDTAHLTVNVTNDRPALGTNYLVRVHYASIEETRPVSVAGRASLVFDIPLPQVTGEPLFLGISHPDGRSLYINTFHIRRADALATVTLDQQVYLPGGSVAITATTASAGTLVLSAPGYSETINVTGPVSRSFTIPADLPGGTYFVSWTFAGGAGSASGSVPFDVAGLRVRVFEAELDKGRYGTGEAIETTLQVNTNQATSATLRAFILDPEGLSQAVGETIVALSPEADLIATHSWPFASVVAGLHRLVYGIYQPSSDTLLASGSLAFDVGSAAVLRVRTHRADYPVPDTPVVATVSTFVSQPANLRLLVDGQSVATTEVTTIGMVELPVSLDGIAPGAHDLVAVMEGGGYTSRASTTFSMGSSLPDLVPGFASVRPVSGASWKIDVAVSNVGRSDAPATQLRLRDVTTSGVLGTVELPALTAGASTVVSLDWNVLGRAGSREVEVVADAAEAIREFREDNNRSVSLLEIPSLVIDAVAAPSYPANVEAGLGASVTNLTADTSYTGFTVSASVARPDGALIPLPAAPLPPVEPGATLAVATPWLVGRSVPGTYVLQSRLLDTSGATAASGAAAFEVLPTFAFAGTVTASPNPAATGHALTLGGHIENQGNVAATGTARFELVAPDHTIAAAATRPADVPVEGSTDVTASIDPLDVQPGDYDVVLEMEVQDQLHPIARSPLTVTGARVEATIEADLTPRTLVYVGGLPHDAPGVARRKAFVQASLAGTGALLKTTSNPFEFAKLFRSGLWNTYVIMPDAPLVVPLLGDELREAVFRGDGLVYVPLKSAGVAREIEPALGVKVDGPISMPPHTLEVLDGALGHAQTLVVRSAATRLQLAGATLAGKIGPVPVLTVNTYGQGRDVTMGFDPAALPDDPARAALQALFARAVLYAAPLQARVPAAGTVVPLGVNLENPGSTAQPLEVTLDLPAGLRIAALEDSPVAQDPPTWQLNLAAGDHTTLRFHVLLPDQAGTYSIESTVKVNGQAFADPPQRVLDVARTTGEALAQVIADLQSKTVALGDRGHLQSAILLLQAAQSLPGNLLGLEGRIRLAAEAAEELGRIQSADLGAPRGEVDRLIAAWERSSYELLGP